MISSKIIWKECQQIFKILVSNRRYANDSIYEGFFGQVQPDYVHDPKDIGKSSANTTGRSGSVEKWTVHEKNNTITIKVLVLSHGVQCRF